MTPQALIKDADYARSLETQGFCVAPLFTVEQIRSMKDLYHQFSIDNKVSGLIASHSKTTAEQSKSVCNQISEILMPALEKSFENFDIFIAGFMVKEANTPNELPLHQDWNILDENLYTSYQVWVPLDLSHPENGGMIVLPGSHHFFNNYRSGSYGIPVVNIDDSLKPLVVDMIIPPGSALIFHNSLFHASYPNHSDANRISAIVSVYQKNAQLRYYDKNVVEDRTDIYGITSDIFLESLNKLENKGIPDHPVYKTTTALCKVENDKITSAELVSGFKKYFGEDYKGFEPLQLHILRDETLEEKLRRDGYTVMDLLDDKTVAELKQEYVDQFSAPHTAIGRFTPMEHSTPAAKRGIHNFILDRIKPELDKIFKDYQTPIASYFTKYAHSTGDLSWHTDASLLLNTHLEPHYGIWCPLVDVCAKNGVFILIEGSHKFSHTVFLNGLEWPYLSHADQFEKKKKVLDLKAGQIVLFDLRLIHHATANETDEDRICFCVRFTHEKSKFYSFLIEEDDKSVVSVYEEGKDFYLADEWSGANQVGLRNKIGKMNNIYSVIDHTRIKAALGVADVIPG